MAFGGMRVENPNLDMDGDQSPQSTFWEGAGAALESGYLQTPVKELADHFVLGMYEYGKTASAEELNEKYPFMPEPFSEPEDIGKAAEMAARVMKRNELQRTVDEGPKGALYGLTSFAAQMIPHAVDPLNLAAGMGVTAAIAKAGIATRLTAMAASKYGKVAVGAGVQAADMFAGNMIGELAAQGVEEAEQRGGSFNTAVFNSAVGAGFGMGMIGAGKGLKWLATKNKGLQDMAISTSAAQVKQGRTPVVDNILNRVLDETNVKTDNYIFSPLADRIKDPVSGEIILNEKAGSFWIALDESHGDFNTGRSLPAGQNHMGDNVVHLTDNKGHANSTAASPYKDAHGSIVEVSLEGKRVLNLDNPPKGLEDISKEAITSNDPELAQAAMAVMKENGYDGFIYSAKEVAGRPHEPHNAVVLFNKEKIIKREAFAPDETKVKQMSHEDMKNLHEESKQDLILIEKQKDPTPFDEDQLKALDSEDFSHMEKRIDEEVKELETLDNSDIKDKEFLKEVDTLKKEMDDDYSLMKTGIGCLLELF